MSFVSVASADELTEYPLAVEIPDSDLEIAIVRIGSEVFAIQDLCSHANVRLSEGDVDEDECTLECYLHGSGFDLRTGRPTSLPATQPVPIYPVKIADGTVLVDVDNPIKTQEN